MIKLLKFDNLLPPLRHSCGRMTTANTFLRRNDVEILVLIVVLVSESKALYY